MADDSGLAMEWQPQYPDFVLAPPVRPEQGGTTQTRSVSFRDVYAHLIEYSDLDDEIQANGLWSISGGVEVRIARLILPQGGHVEFAKNVSLVNFYFLPSTIPRTIRFWYEPWVRTRETGALGSDNYFDLANDLALDEPPSAQYWKFHQHFDPPINALEIYGPVALSWASDVVATGTGMAPTTAAGVHAYGVSAY